MCGRAYETYTDKELNARYIRGAPTADDIQQLILMPEPVYNLCPTMNSPVLRVVDGIRRLDLMHWQHSAIRVVFQDEAHHDQRQKRDRIQKSAVRRAGRAATMHRSNKWILRMEARRKDQKAIQDSSRRRTDNEPGRRVGHVATGIKT